MIVSSRLNKVLGFDVSGLVSIRPKKAYSTGAGRCGDSHNDKIRIADSGRSLAWVKVIFIFVLGLGLSGCLNNMRDQPRYEPLEASDFFADGRSARPLVTGAVPRGLLEVDQVTPTPQPTQTTQLDEYPFQITMDVLKRGQEQYEIYCSPCHGYDGYGRGMIVQRGFSPPPSLHSETLRQMPGSQIYDVISNGFGRMASYAYRVTPEDRWAIIAYIRALQLSQNANIDLVPPEELGKLQPSP